MKNRITLLCALLLALCLLAGCAETPAAPSDSQSASTTGAPARETESKAPEDDRSAPLPESEQPDPAEVPQTGAADSEAPDTEAPGTEAPETEAPGPDTAETDAPESEAPDTEAPSANVPETEPAAEDRPIFVQEADYFTNGIVKIWNEEGRIIRQDLESGTETILFRLEQNDGIETKLFGVTDNRLYFGWNEVEDWWGYNIYSVDYQGKNKTEYGEAWDPMFDGGWLILYGFRSDVSATELRVIDRDDMVAVDLENVWDGVVAEDGAFYFIYGGELPEEISEWFEEHENRDVEFKVLRLSPEGDFSIHGSLYFNRYYEPCFINFTTIGFPEADEYYDLFTLEPVEAPVYG